MNTATNEKNQVKDRSGNRKYFTMVLRIVRLKARSPYDVAAWLTVMDIAGETGECDYSTDDLAALSGMSTGKFSDCRSYLIEQGLLNGNIQKLQNSGQSRWSLTVPDLWEENVKLSQQCNTIEKRIKYNKQYVLNAIKKPSPHEGTKPSLSESKPSPHEGKPSCGEAPSFIEKNLLEEPLEDRAPKALPFSPLKKYSAEWDMWKAEQGDELFEKAFGTKRIWDVADLQGFTRLREAGENLGEITNRFKLYLADPNWWYATKGYSFAEFANNYNTFSPVIAARKASKNGAPAKNGNYVIDRTEDVSRNIAEAILMERRANGGI